jgi:hydrogenase maturation protease
MADRSLVFCDRPEDLAAALWALIPHPTAVVGIGNPLRGDDGFGPAVVAALRPSAGLYPFDVQAVPESFLVPIVESGCGGVLFVDAADLRAEPGRVALVPAAAIREVDISTHGIALSLVAEAVCRLAREARGAEPVCALVAAQPADLDRADRLSPAMEKAAGLAGEGIRAFACGTRQRASLT